MLIRRRFLELEVYGIPSFMSSQIWSKSSWGEFTGRILDIQIVEPNDLASFGGGGNVGAEVLSTPRLILLMEQAARDAVVDTLPEGMMSVGTLIHMKHLAATPLGVKVRAEAYLKKVDRRRLVFDVVVYDEFERIAVGANERFVVSIDKFIENIKRKRTNRKQDIP